jgi:hypothetical protein
MALPNNFSQTKQKLYKMFHEAAKQNYEIVLHRDQQLLVIRELNRAKTQTLDFKGVNNIEFEFVNLNTANLYFIDYNPDFVTPLVDNSETYDPPHGLWQAWSVQLRGFKFEEALNVKHNFLFKFGGMAVDKDIVWQEHGFRTTHFIQVDSTEDTTNNVFTFHFGIRLTDSTDLSEAADGIQCKLLLTVYNTKTYQ